ncbi:hypothetical protein EK904_002833 [Melospiza melodia maxima]|nr:hypothetical protein EK904_002833 [Melospiza melodia maxima]
MVIAGLGCVGDSWGASGRVCSGLSFSFPAQDLKKYGATTVVRVCEVTYDKTPLEKDGITVMVGGQQDVHRGAAPTPPLIIPSLGAVKHPGSPAQHHTEAGAELEAQLS